MGLHIGNSYRGATFNCMKGRAEKKDVTRGARIRSMRKALELNQEDLAALIDLDQSTVSDIENGAGFSADVLMKLAERLGGTPSTLMRGHDEAAWPFKYVPMERFLALKPEQRAVVEGALITALNAVNGPNPEDVLRSMSHTRHSTRKSARRKKA